MGDFDMMMRETFQPAPDPDRIAAAARIAEMLEADEDGTVYEVIRSLNVADRLLIMDAFSARIQKRLDALRAGPPLFELLAGVAVDAGESDAADASDETADASDARVLGDFDEVFRTGMP